MSNKDNIQDNEIWERKAIKDVLIEHVTERRRARRWGIFFKLIFIIFIVFIIWQVSIEPVVDKKIKVVDRPHIAKIEIHGMIADKHSANADEIIDALYEAYADVNTKAIVLDINSPGGTPVHARRIYNAIQYLQKDNPKIKVYAVIGDIGTSAAYLIASAAHEIYADETSFIGSIGALVNSFGFVNALEKLGIERRLYVAGKYKGMLDPFLKEDAQEVQFIQESLNVVHQEFINNVKNGRGKRLHDDPSIFSGRFWTGKEAYNIGLIDGFGDIHKIAKEIIKVDEIVDYTQPENVFEKIMKNLPHKVTSMLLEAATAPSYL